MVLQNDLAKGREYGFDPLFQCGPQGLVNFVVKVKELAMGSVVVESLDSGEIFRASPDNLVTFEQLKHMYPAYKEADLDTLPEQFREYRKTVILRMEKMLWHFEVEEATKPIPFRKGEKHAG